jgi:DNA-binding NarL/FixJ family response regulator
MRPFDGFWQPLEEAMHTVTRNHKEKRASYRLGWNFRTLRADGWEALERAREVHPDVVLMDLLMPGMDGIAATAAIRQELPDIEVLALTSVLESAAVVRAVKAGAIGYLLKDTQAAELRRAIKAAAAGQAQLAPQASAFLLRHLQAVSTPEPLTERETEVLHLLAQGRANKEISRHLQIAEDTVKVHVRHILAKLGAQSRTQAVLIALHLGLVSPDQENR